MKINLLGQVPHAICNVSFTSFTMSLPANGAVRGRCPGMWTYVHINLHGVKCSPPAPSRYFTLTIQHLDSKQATSAYSSTSRSKQQLTPVNNIDATACAKHRVPSTDSPRNWWCDMYKKNSTGSVCNSIWMVSSQQKQPCRCSATTRMGKILVNTTLNAACMDNPNAVNSTNKMSVFFFWNQLHASFVFFSLMWDNMPCLYSWITPSAKRRKFYLGESAWSPCEEGVLSRIQFFLFFLAPSDPHM